MKDFNIAIIGCGNVGGGTARILLELKDDISVRAGRKINLVKISETRPEVSAKRWNLPKELFTQNTKEILEDKNIDLVVETIGGDSSEMAALHENILRSGKNLVTANKALLAKTGKKVFDAAKECGKSIGIEAAVCGAIPIIRTIDDGFTGDEILGVSGIMNGTSNFILSSMDERGISFADALKEAQALGYAEADPALDISGADACNKLKILIQHIYGIDAAGQKMPCKGITEITPVDVAFAKVLGCKIKLIGYVKRENSDIYACVQPMMVTGDNVLSNISGATNAVRLVNRYSKENILVGPGAGPLETGSAIVSDIIFIARQNSGDELASTSKNYELKDFAQCKIRYNIIVKTKDKPGVTGIVASAIGRENINILTIGPNIHEGEYAYFPICTEPATAAQIRAAVDDINKNYPGVIFGGTKLFPVLAK